MLKRLGWLVLFLLPLAGMFAGQALRTDYRVLWTTQCDYPVTTRLLGWLDGGKQLVLGEANFNGDGYPPRVVEGTLVVDTATGSVLHRGPLPLLPPDPQVISNDSCHLTPQCQLLLCVNPTSGSGQKDSRVMQVNPVSLAITRQWKGDRHLAQPRAAGDTCIAQSGGNAMLLWHDQQAEPTVIPLDSFAEVGLSGDGLMAHARRFGDKKTDLVIVDVKLKTVLQVIPGVFHEVQWAANHQSFLAFTFDTTTEKKYCQRYVRQGNEYVADAGSRFSFAGYGNMQHHGCWISHTLSASSQPSRKWLGSVLGETGKPVLDWLWPHGVYVQLISPETGRTVHEHKVSMHPAETVMPHPDGLRLVCRDNFSLRLLEFYPAQAWWPIVGLVVGLIPLLLVTLRYRRRPIP